MPGEGARLVNPTPGKCRTCGKDVRHPRQYCDEHRPASAQKVPKQQGRAKRQRDTAKSGSARAVVSDALNPPDSPAPKRTTVDSTSKLLARLLVYVTIFIAMYLVSSDPDLLSDEQKEAQVEELQLHEEDARSIAHPIARALHPTAIWQKYGAVLVEHSDVLDAVAALYDYGSGLARYQRRRGRASAARQAAPSNGHVPRGAAITVPMEEAIMEPVPDTWGSQIGPSEADIERFRAQRAGEQ